MSYCRHVEGEAPAEPSPGTCWRLRGASPSRPNAMTYCRRMEGEAPAEPSPGTASIVQTSLRGSVQFFSGTTRKSGHDFIISSAPRFGWCARCRLPVMHMA